MSERELGALDAKIEQLEKRVDKHENNTQKELKELKASTEQELKDIKKQNDELKTYFESQNKNLENNLNSRFQSLGDKIDNLKHESTFSKGFIKAIFVMGSILGVLFGLALKFVK